MGFEWCAEEIKTEKNLKMKDRLYRYTDMGKRKLDLDLWFCYFTSSIRYFKQGHR